MGSETSRSTEITGIKERLTNIIANVSKINTGLRRLHHSGSDIATPRDASAECEFGERKDKITDIEIIVNDSVSILNEIV